MPLNDIAHPKIISSHLISPGALRAAAHATGRCPQRRGRRRLQNRRSVEQHGATMVRLKSWNIYDYENRLATGDLPRYTPHMTIS